MIFSYRLEGRDTRPEGERNKRGRGKVAGGEVVAADIPEAVTKLADELRSEFSESFCRSLVRLTIETESD